MHHWQTLWIEIRASVRTGSLGKGPQPCSTIFLSAAVRLLVTTNNVSWALILGLKSPSQASLSSGPATLLREHYQRLVLCVSLSHHLLCDTLPTWFPRSKPADDAALNKETDPACSHSFLSPSPSLVSNFTPSPHSSPPVPSFSFLPLPPHSAPLYPVFLKTYLFLDSIIFLLFSHAPGWSSLKPSVTHLF